MTPRAILFDWTGTLATVDPNAPPFARRFTASLSAIVGQPLDEASLVHAFQSALHETANPRLEPLIQTSLEHLGIRLSHAALHRASDAFAEIEFGSHQLYPEARALLASLKFRGFRVGVVTNQLVTGAQMRPVFRSLGIAGYVETLVTSGDADGRGKPDPATLYLALERMALAPPDAWFVGDSPENDIAAAKAAGLQPALIDRAGHHASNAEDYPVLRSLAGLPGLLGEGLATNPGL